MSPRRIHFFSSFNKIKTQDLKVWSLANSVNLLLQGQCIVKHDT